MTLTKQEQEAIEREAEAYVKDLYKYYAGKGNPDADLAVVPLKRNSEQDYIAAATAYALKAKVLVGALRSIQKELAINDTGRYAIEQALSTYNQPSGE